MSAWKTRRPSQRIVNEQNNEYLDVEALSQHGEIKKDLLPCRAVGAQAVTQASRIPLQKKKKTIPFSGMTDLMTLDYLL